MDVNAQAKYGSWALVTGASSGIGEEFTRQLAAKGFNVVLVARRKACLNKIAAELEIKNHVKTRVVAVDLGEPSAISTIAKATDDVDVGLLVSNAAMISWGAFEKCDVAVETKIVQVNVVAALQLAHHFGRRMIQCGKGGIVFVASTAGYACVPFMANYIATKAYLISLGEALNYEFRGKGVDVTVLCPGSVETRTPEERRRTKLDEGMDMDTMGAGMSVTPVVATALSALGRKTAVIPGFSNRIMAFAFKHLLTRNLTTRVFGSMIRKAVSAELQ